MKAKATASITKKAPPAPTAADDIAYLEKLRSKPHSFHPLSEYLAERRKADV